MIVWGPREDTFNKQQFWEKPTKGGISNGYKAPLHLASQKRMPSVVYEETEIEANQPEVGVVSDVDEQHRDGDDSSDQYDTDMEVEESSEPDAPTPEDESVTGRISYLEACALLHITPSKRILDGLDGPELNLRYRCVGPAGAKALAAALLHNCKVEDLNLEENGLDEEGGMYIADILKENSIITQLNLSRNHLGSLGAYVIGEMLKTNNGITHLNISDNNFRDSDAEYLAIGIEKNERVIHLDMSHNGFSEDGAVYLGRAIGSNNSIEHLDLSWNQIRRKGSVSMCNGLKRNYCITHVNLAWNGFGYEGALAVGEMLKGNKYLHELDISHNRFNWEAALFVAKGLKENDTLEALKIGGNPLTMTGVLDILESVEGTLSVVNFVGFDEVPVNRRVLYVTENIQKIRSNFRISYGALLDSEDIFGKRPVLRCDPLKLLIQFLGDKGIRPVDLFRTFDKDNQHRVSREQFIQGLRKAKVPLDDYEVERVLNRLDSAKEGKISYQRLMRGVKEQIKVNREEEKKRLQDEKRVSDEHRRIMNPGLPPISEAHSEASRSLTSMGTSRQRPGSASSILSAITLSTILPWSLASLSNRSAASSRSSILSKAALQRHNQTMDSQTAQAQALSSTSKVSLGSQGQLPKISMSAPLTQPEPVLSEDNINKTVVQKTPKKKKKTKKKGAN